MAIHFSLLFQLRGWNLIRLPLNLGWLEWLPSTTECSGSDVLKPLRLNDERIYFLLGLLEYFLPEPWEAEWEVQLACEPFTGRSLLWVLQSTVPGEPSLPAIVAKATDVQERPSWPPSTLPPNPPPPGITKWPLQITQKMEESPSHTLLEFLTHILGKYKMVAVLSQYILG